MPWLKWLEKVAKPRLAVFDHVLALRLMGVVLFLFSLALIFAAPVIGQIPLGLAVCLVGLGLVERDGYVVVAGIVVGALGHEPEPGLPVRCHRQRGSDLLRAFCADALRRSTEATWAPVQSSEARCASISSMACGRDGLAEQVALQLMATDRLAGSGAARASRRPPR